MQLLIAVEHGQVGTARVLSDEALDGVLHLRHSFNYQYLRDNHDLAHEGVDCEAEAVSGVFLDQGHTENQSPAFVVDSTEEDQTPPEPSPYQLPVYEHDIMVETIALLHFCCHEKEVRDSTLSVVLASQKRELI